MQGIPPRDLPDGDTLTAVDGRLVPASTIAGAVSGSIAVNTLTSATGVGKNIKGSQIADGVTGGVLTIAGTLTAPRTITIPDASVTIPAGTLLAGTLANANRLDSTSGAGVVKESQIADGVTGNVLTIAGTLTGLRTQTARDASGNLCLDSVDNGFSAGQTITAAAGLKVRQGATTDAIVVAPANVGSSSNTITDTTPASPLGANFIHTRQALTGTVVLRDAGTKDGIFDWSNAISVTGAVTATAGRLHVCTGTTADYTVTLPSIASSIGQSMAFVMGSALTRLVTLDANAAELIDGSLTRIMWANEVAIIYNNGTQWVKVSGKSLPMTCRMTRTTAQSVAATTFTQIVTSSVVDDSTSALAVPMADTTNGRAKILRPGYYTAGGGVVLVAMTTTVLIGGGIVKNSTVPAANPNAFVFNNINLTGYGYAAASGTFSCVAGDWIGVSCYTTDSATRNTATATNDQPTLSVIEVPSW